MTRDRERGLQLSGVSRETASLLDRYVELLERWQKVQNLVGPKTLAEVWVRHIADSAQLLAFAPEALTWVDLGSGAGFPGLVIAVLLRDKPEAGVHLVESNSRKCAFLREVNRTLGLRAIIHDGRIEDVLSTLPSPVDVVSARALAPLVHLLAMSAKLLTTGSLGIFPKGQDVGDELTEASKYWRIQSRTAQSVTDPKARIVLIEKLAPLSTS